MPPCRKKKRLQTREDLPIVQVGVIKNVVQNVYNIRSLLQVVFGFIAPQKERIKQFLSLASVCSTWYQTFHVWFPNWSRPSFSFSLHAKNLGNLSSYAISCIGKLKIPKGRASLAMLMELRHLKKVYIYDFTCWLFTPAPPSGILSLSIGRMKFVDFINDAFPPLPSQLTCLRLGKDVYLEEPVHLDFSRYTKLTRLRIDSGCSMRYFKPPPHLARLSLCGSWFAYLHFDPFQLTHLECRYDLLSLPCYSSLLFPNMIYLTVWPYSSDTKDASGSFLERMSSLTFLTLQSFYTLSWLPVEIPQITHLGLTSMRSRDLKLHCRLPSLTMLSLQSCYYFDFDLFPLPRLTTITLSGASIHNVNPMIWKEYMPFLTSVQCLNKSSFCIISFPLLWEMIVDERSKCKLSTECHLSK
jgi:hypothetical protein